MPDEDTDTGEDEEEVDDPAPRRKKAKKTEPERTWKKEDINHPALPPFTHPAPACLRTPFQYFEDMFTADLVDDIVYQTNLYARQKNVNTTFNIDRHELMVFIGIVLYMGVCVYPSIEDYWGMNTRCMQVADFMSSKRFRLIRSLVHFNNNDNIAGVTDRFFKVRPLIASITRQFLQVKATPTQSIDEVMVSYKGTRAGNLRQYIQTKPDKWGMKLFCRASVDGFIHDILMYQGETTFTSHHTQLSPEESEMLVSSKTVVVLAKTLENPKDTAIYADNFFTSIGLVEYLKQKVGCRYVGTARQNRIGHAPLISSKEMDKKTHPRGDYNYCSSNGILALRWKDNKNVTVLSSDAGVEPVQKVKRYDRTSKKKVDVKCPNVIREYNGKMGGIDKSDMLTHLYKTPMRARRWYLRIFGYTLDLCVCNAWILYKRDCKALDPKMKPMNLKNFRLEVSIFARGVKSLRLRYTRSSPSSQDATPPIPRRGIRSVCPSDEQRFDVSKSHLPIYVPTRQTCKSCSKKNDMHRSRWMCKSCQVALCLSDSRNCFTHYHTPPNQPSSLPPVQPEQQPSPSASSP